MEFLKWDKALFWFCLFVCLFVSNHSHYAKTEFSILTGQVHKQEKAILHQFFLFSLSLFLENKFILYSFVEKLWTLTWKLKNVIILYSSVNSSFPVTVQWFTRVDESSLEIQIRRVQFALSQLPYMLTVHLSISNPDNALMPKMCECARTCVCVHVRVVKGQRGLVCVQEGTINNFRES